MSRITTFKCDRCKKESVGKDELGLAFVAVGIKKEQYGMFHRDAFDLRDSASRGMEMCKACRVELGVELPEKVAEPVQEQPVIPTLETMIREICRQEIQECEQPTM
jgi:hypothetical protein